MQQSLNSGRFYNIETLEVKDLEVSDSDPERDYNLGIASSNNEMSDEVSSYFKPSPAGQDINKKFDFDKIFSKDELALPRLSESEEESSQKTLQEPEQEDLCGEDIDLIVLCNQDEQLAIDVASKLKA